MPCEYPRVRSEDASVNLRDRPVLSCVFEHAVHLAAGDAWSACTGCGYNVIHACTGLDADETFHMARMYWTPAAAVFCASNANTSVLSGVRTRMLGLSGELAFEVVTRWLIYR